jgi:aryl-alcohol dehydrogenase-like predicted oxidoreductase
MNEAIRFAPRRVLGRTGFVATVLGIGDVADRAVPLEQCVETVRRAMDAGLNVIDTAPMYENGYSEEIVGEALAGRREGMFVIDKIDHFDQPLAAQVEGSLGRLKLDTVDAFVFHGCSTLEDWRRIAAPGGMMEQLGQFVRAGRVRFRGISSHHPLVLAEAIRGGLCDLVLFPVGPFCDRRYIDEILPLARERQVGTVCFKTFGAGKLLGDTAGYGKPLAPRPRGKLSSGGQESAAAGSPATPTLNVSQCVHYTLSCDPDVALLGMSFPNEQDAAFQAAAAFKSLEPETMDQIRAQAAKAIEGKGPHWWNPS